MSFDLRYGYFPMDEFAIGGDLIASSSGFYINNFQEKDLTKAGYATNPLEDHSLDAYQVFVLPLNDLTLNASQSEQISHSKALKCKNMFALGVVYWLYDKPMDMTITWLQEKFAEDEAIATANIAAIKAGYNYALTAELFSERYQVHKAKLAKGYYRQITGNQAFALACVALTAQTKTKSNVHT